VVSFTLWPLYHRGNSPRHPLDRRPSGPLYVYGWCIDYVNFAITRIRSSNLRPFSPWAVALWTDRFRLYVVKICFWMLWKTATSGKLLGARLGIFIFNSTRSGNNENRCLLQCKTAKLDKCAFQRFGETCFPDNKHAGNSVRSVNIFCMPFKFSCENPLGRSKEQEIEGWESLFKKQDLVMWTGFRWLQFQ
jgi:hypothetical protein